METALKLLIGVPLIIISVPVLLCGIAHLLAWWDNGDSDWL